MNLKAHIQLAPEGHPRATINVVGTDAELYLHAACIEPGVGERRCFSLALSHAEALDLISRIAKGMVRR